MFTRLRAHAARIALLAAVVFPAAIISAQAPANRQSTGKGFIWKFEREGRVGWLVGSLHLLSADFYPLPGSMNQAFAGADMLVEEIDMDEASNPAFAAMVLSKAIYPAGTTLATELSPATLKILTAWLSRNGLAMATFQQMKPWMVSLTLQTLALQKIGFDPAFGIDKHFADNAQKSKKPFLALETAAEQIDFLDRLSPRTQDLMLRESLESADTELQEIKAIAAAWRVGDVAAVEKLALSSLQDAPEVYQSLLVERNKRWVPKIETCVQTQRCFVVVGAAHLVGPDGLITLLKQKGYAVEQQ
ncbi:MAG TPA: TraB/GumN family protein [Vicinamibacterales bacterium]|nr:TraB/GumN family protein [Vicinamibacterales bacterium]